MSTHSVATSPADSLELHDGVKGFVSDWSSDQRTFKKVALVQHTLEFLFSNKVVFPPVGFSGARLPGRI